MRCEKENSSRNTFPCNTKKADALKIERRAKKIIKLVFFIILLGIIASALTLLTVNLSYYYGDALHLGYGFMWNFNIFFTYIIGFLVTPFVVMYITRQREEIAKELKK